MTGGGKPYSGILYGIRFRTIIIKSVKNLVHFRIPNDYYIFNSFFHTSIFYKMHLLIYLLSTELFRIKKIHL